MSTKIRTVITNAALLGMMAGAAMGDTPAAPCDFNGDGFDDLAVGTPFDDIGAVISAGAVNVLYGGDDGLSAQDDQYWHQDSSGFPGAPAPFEQFGGALAGGDFDNDGFDDLAIGAPREFVGDQEDAGKVYVLYGSAQGLRTAGVQVWHQNSDGIPDDAEAFDIFGAALAAADFDGDGFADLAISVPQEEFDGGLRTAGQVHVLYGSVAGLRAEGNQLWHQDTPGVRGVLEEDDAFGLGLETGDFNGDGFGDLAVGVPFESLGVDLRAGQVHILHGSAEGLTADGDQVWHQGVEGIEGHRHESELFGRALAAGDFNGDGFDDLAIGVAVDDTPPASESCGAVNVLYGSAAGLRTNGNKRWHQEIQGVEGDAEAFDIFGGAIIGADFDGDGFDDLAIGAPGEDTDGQLDSGAVNVLYGSALGLTADGDQYWTQLSQGITDRPEMFDSFGRVLTAGDFNGNGRFELVIVAPSENVGGVEGAGALHVLDGGASGLRGAGSQFWHQDVPGVLGAASPNDEFGGQFD